MEKIEAIVRPEKVSAVKDGLAEVGLVGINVVQVIGRGAQRGVVSGGPRGVGRSVVDMIPKAKIELVVKDGDAQKAIDAIVSNARTGEIGDGKIFVTQIANAIRVRTGEEGSDAI